MTHRASYWKTITISFLAAWPCLFALVRLFSLRLALLPFSLICFLLAAITLTCLLIATGGFVCLWRDAREMAGMADFLALSANRIPRPRLLSELWFRFVPRTRLRPGDLVEVRPCDEIEATLDEKGTMAGLPFMSEMVPFCNGVFRVHRRIDHINDMRNKAGLRRIRDVVTLTNVRCCGSAHDGCQAECQILWKDAWLKRLPEQHHVETIQGPAHLQTVAVHAANSAESDKTYFCQMTALSEASQRISSLDIRQDFRPLLAGNISLTEFLLVLLTRLFNTVQRLRGGAGYPFMPNYSISGTSPSAKWHFEAGNAVVVCSKDEIARTLVNGRNKGLWFDRDMIRFCGQRGIVRQHVTRLIHERSGKMVIMKNPCVTLENVTATGEFLRLCSQHENILWREIWLSRCPKDQPTAMGRIGGIG